MRRMSFLWPGLGPEEGFPLPMDASPPSGSSLASRLPAAPVVAPRALGCAAATAVALRSKPGMGTRQGKWRGGVVTPIRVRLHCMWCRRHGRPGEKNPGGVSSSRFPWRMPRRCGAAGAAGASGSLMTRAPYFGSYRRFGRQQTLNFRVVPPKYRVHGRSHKRTRPECHSIFPALAYAVHCLASRRHGNGPPLNGRHETRCGEMRQPSEFDHRIPVLESSQTHTVRAIPHRLLRHRVGHRRFPAPIKRRPPPVEAWVAGGKLQHPVCVPKVKPPPYPTRMAHQSARWHSDAGKKP